MHTRSRVHLIAAKSADEQFTNFSYRDGEVGGVLPQRVADNVEGGTIRV